MIILHILLWILKIIGILILVVLGLFVLGMVVVLFVPVRYEGKISGDVADWRNAQGYVRISYLLRIFQIRLRFAEQKFEWEIRIAWKKIGQDKKEHRKEAEKEKKAVREKKIVPEQKPVAVMEKPSSDQKKGTKQKHVRKPDVVKKTSDKKKKAEKKSLSRRLTDLYKNICGKMEGLQEKIKKAEKRKEQIWGFFTDKVHKDAFRKGKTVLCTFLKAWKPEKLQGFMVYGMDDPYYTGKLLAYLAMLYPFYGEWLQITPDFENLVLKGDLYIKGHLRMNHAAAAVIKLVSDKNVRSTVREIWNLRKRPGKKKEEKSNGRQ